MPALAEDWDFLIAPSRARAVDLNLRQRLIGSLQHLASIIERPDVAGACAAVGRQLQDGPVSPWVFAHYAAAVSDLSSQRPGTASEHLLSMKAAPDLGAAQNVLPYADTAVPSEWWAVFDKLFDTDKERNFRVRRPSVAALDRFRHELSSAMGVLAVADPEIHDDTCTLIRLLVPASPASAAPVDGFNGGSTFFFWGGALFNADISRGAVAMIDLLVHEAGHLYLFGLLEGGALTTNPPGARYASPLRSDPRPIDGIFHAGYVSTRVHYALSRLLDSGRLPAGLRDAAERQRQTNGEAARVSLDLLQRHAQPSPAGSEILDALAGYWREHVT